MDRDTIKNLLMTTSVVAIIAGTAEKANAIPSPCVGGAVVSQSTTYTQTTNVNCIIIENQSITGDVIVSPNVVVGTTGLAEVFDLDSAITGSIFNNGTLAATLIGNFQFGNAGIEVAGTSTVGNGITNGAGTGVISLFFNSTATSGVIGDSGQGILIGTSSFNGNVVNNGAINLTALVDPGVISFANMTGMAIQTTSFVGNVVNTHTLNVVSTVAAGASADTSAAATARSAGIFSTTGTSTNVGFGGAGTLSSSFSALFQGNVTNSGVINALAMATALSQAGTGPVSATAVGDGIAIIGDSFTGNVTSTGTGSLSVTLTDVFTGNITNTDTIGASATALATKIAAAAGAPVTAFAHAFGIQLVGDQLLGNVISGGGSTTSAILSTLSSDFAVNISNTDLISAHALAQATAFASSGTATASVDAQGIGIDIVGVAAMGSVSSTSPGNITNVYSGTFAGSIGNGGTIQANVTASGTASDPSTALATLRQDAEGILFAGLELSGNLSDGGAGNITNTANVTFIGNVSNSGLIAVNGTASGTALTTTGTALTTVDGNAGGISIIGGVFSGNVSRTGGGIITDNGNFTFSGNITNSAAGVITAFDTAAGEVSLSTGSGGGTGVASVRASAGGIRLIGASFTGANGIFGSDSVHFNGDITNNGHIVATAIAGGLALVGGEGATSLGLHVNSDAQGIAVLGAVFSGSAREVGSFTGNITNTGTVAAFATAVGQVSGTVTSMSATVQANADGILTVLDHFSGNIESTGSVYAKATASMSVGALVSGSEAFASADGYDVRARDFTGNVGNNGGTIRVFAQASNNDDHALASASANGIVVDVESLTGNVTNTGAIFVQSNASGTAIGSTATAHGVGMSITGAEGFHSTITNGPGSLIDVGVIANGDTFALANGSGIAVSGTHVFGDVINSGQITVSAQANDQDNAVTHLAEALVAGIVVGDPALASGIFVQTFSGNVSNSGIMSVLATSSSQVEAVAGAGGIVIANTHFGSLIGLTSYSGNVSNTGTIAAHATANATSVAEAFAGGIVTAASEMTGNVTNAGVVTAVAMATQFGPSLGSVASWADANAMGIAVTGGTNIVGPTFGLFSFTGNVTNTSSGAITVRAIANVSTTLADAHAHAAGILLAGGSFSEFRFFGIRNLSGNVTNQGFISSSASAGNQGDQAYAAGFGIEVLFSTFTGNVANGGTITSTAIAVATGSTEAAAIAHANGILLGGFEGFAHGTDTNLFAGLGSSAAGNISNTGMISAAANASISLTFGTFAILDAFATGIGVQSSTFAGNISNSSSGFISASASTTSPGAIFAFGSAMARGIEVGADTFLGNVSNAGTVLASATSTSGSSLLAPAIAEATGISIGANTYIGNITNTGFIAASASASQVAAFGSTLSVATDQAAGIALFDTLAIGTVANSGTLVHVSTFVGNIKNAGTIMAFSNANASGSGIDVALDPATGILVGASTFVGAVNNLGLIVAGATATATGPTTRLSAVALSGGIGVNVPNFDTFFFPGNIFAPPGFVSTSTFVGSISNAGSIMANANAALNIGIGLVAAGATGIRAFADTFSGDISNSGFIQATATATNNGVFAFGSAFATGVHIGGVVGTHFSTGPGSTITALINFAPISRFAGNVSNTGTIMAFATSFNLPIVYSAGIQIDASLVTGNISNLSKGMVSANAFITGFGSTFALADGIYVDASTYVGNVSNDGTIVASATAANAPTAIASAVGIDLASINTFLGSISNTGRIQANAIASTGTAFARATATGIDLGTGTFIGDVTNTGTISAFATAMVASGLGGQQFVTARGINVDGNTFTGNINNNAPGVVVAIANAPAGGATGTATGIRIDPNTFTGNVSNTGTVMATGIGNGIHALGISVFETFVGNINNNGAGVILAKSSTYAAGIYIGANTFMGNINNSALIMASGDATGIYSNPGTFVGAINNTGTIIGTGGSADRGIRVVGASITGGINNSGTIQGGFASIDLDQESGTPSTGTVINNKSGGLLKGDVHLSAWADTLNVFGGSTVMGNITGNLSGGGFGNNDFVNFDLNNDGFGHTLPHGFSVYQYKITNVNTVDLTSGTLVLDDQDIVGTVTLGPGNIDPVGTFNQSGGTGISTLGLVVDAGHPTTLGPSTPPTVKTITLSTGAGQNIGAVVANTVNIGTGASFRAFPEADFYANTNIYPNVVVGLTSMNGNYAETNVTSNSPLLTAFMIENGGTGPAGSDTLVLTRRAFNNPLGVGLTPNENAAGGGLEGLYKTGNGTAMTIIPPLFGLSGPQYAAVLKSLDGETILERPDLWQTVLDSILHRLSQGEGFNGQSFAGAMLSHGPIQVASAGFSDDDSQVAQMTPMPGPTGVVQPWSVWVRGYGVFGNGPSTINATSFSENRYGGIGGIDYHVTNNLLVGGVFNYAHGEVDLDPPTPATNKQDAYQFAAYGKYQQGPWYVNAVAGGGFTNNSETRQVLIPSPATVNGSYNGETFSAYLEGGWDLYPVSNVKLTPLVGVGYNWLRYDGFQESGSASALHVSAATTDNLYTALGARAQTAINIGTSAPLVPELRVVWQHEFLDANQEMNAAFGGGTLFNVQGSKFSRESVIAGIGISNNVSPDLKLFLDYDAKLQGGYSAHAVSAGLRWSFGGSAPPPPPAAPPPMPAAQPAPPPAAQAQTFVVYFDFDKSVLTPEAMGIIKQAAAAYKQTGAVNLKVDGYTDLAGTAQYNVGLSKRRADVVRAELVKDGVPNNAVAEAWHGKDNPAVPTPDGVREPRNRRATIMLP